MTRVLILNFLRVGVSRLGERQNDTEGRAVPHRPLKSANSQILQRMLSPV